MFCIFAVNLFKFGCRSESIFEIRRVILVTFLGSEIPVPVIKQVFSSNTSVTTYSLFDIGSKLDVILSPHWDPEARVSWVDTLSPILKIFTSFVTSLYVLLTESTISRDFTT